MWCTTYVLIKYIKKGVYINMNYLLFILSLLYGLLMLLASIKLISFKEHPLVFIVNLIGCFTIFLSVVNDQLLYLGVIILFLAALLNGHFVLKHITFSHILFRFIFSVILILLNLWIHSPFY